MAFTFERSRKERFLSLTSHGSVFLSTLAKMLECPEPSVRRLIQELRREGYHITLLYGDVRNYGRFVHPTGVLREESQADTIF